MKFSILILIIPFIQSFVAQAGNLPLAKQNESNTTRKLVHVLFRHGIRTPSRAYSNDPFRNETFLPYGRGQLTNIGKQDLYGMGQWLAQRYHNLMGSYYKPDLIYARSTAMPRTMMSMSTVLAGMFPPNKTPMQWHPQLNWQPIPVFTDPLDKDITLSMLVQCKAYNIMKQNLPLNEKPEGLFQQLSDITGDNITTTKDVGSLFLTLWAEQLYGLKLPPWTHEYFPDKMLYMAEQSFLDGAATIEMQRLKAGPFLQMLIQQMLDKANNNLKPMDRKMFLYCSHDYTITAMLIALKVWKRQMPNFAAMVLFELHQNEKTKEYYMELYYQNGPRNSVEPLTLPGCSFQCPLSKVMELLRDVMPTGSYDEMCGN